MKKKMTEAWLKRQAVWHHNGRRGTVKMALTNMRNIMRAKTTSQSAKETTTEIITLLDRLHIQLETRIDQ